MWCYVNKKKQALLYAYDRGYRVTPEGEVVSPSGIIRKLKCSKSNPRLSFTVRSRILGIMDNVFVHRLQAYQKFGEAIFEEGIEVRHLDNDKFNNSYSNIGIGTGIENMMDIPLHERIERSHHAVLKITKHSEIAEDVRNLRESGATYKDITNKFDISKSTINHILHHAIKTSPFYE